MKSTFGIFTKSQGNVVFGKMRASLVADDRAQNPNHPDNPESPNRPRTTESREQGYDNPMLGDPGRGQIGRWQTVNLDALETVIDQIIEQYLRDKTWYKSVRCREALWNMYRRLEWWVKNQKDPNRGDYQRALQMIKDCINHILEEAQDPALSHNVSLPLCPAPYYFPFNAAYFNHFDNHDVEKVLFDMTALPKSDDFPGLFRYVSSVEDQEWDLVHGTGPDEMVGSENIMKLRLNRLLPGNSSKITFNWRWKRAGYISFKYWAGAASGNGLNFFINNNQVGGEWSGGSGWQEARFNVAPGQTYKFDWFVRKQTEDLFGVNAIYIKDVKCVEVIRSLGGDTPPDYDTMGTDAYAIPGYAWITYSGSSVVKTHFNGVVTEGNRSRTFVYHLDNECDGVVTFAYRMGTAQPALESENYWMFLDNLRDRVQTAQGKHGSSVRADHGPEWTLDGTSSSTQANLAKISYELVVGDKCTVDARGAIEMVCPPLEIDHYDDTTIQTMESASWNQSGNLYWQVIGTATDRTFRVDNPVQGSGAIQTGVSLIDDGWFDFSFDHNLRPSETLEALVDGEVTFSSKGSNANSVRIPLKQGYHNVSFRIVDSFTEQGITATTERDYSYGSGSGFINGQFGSNFTVQRYWDASNAGTTTAIDGNEIIYTVNLNPGASLNVTEMLRLSAPTDISTSSVVFEEVFNEVDGSYDPRISMSPNWEWEDLPHRFNEWASGDGVYKVENKDGSTNTVTLSGVSLSNDGFVEFEYGGQFGAKENLEFLIDGVVVWADSQSTVSDNGNYVRVPVSAGNHIYQWVYRDLGGTVYTDPNTGGTTTDSGEVCFTSGRNSIPIQYDNSSWWTQTDRQSVLQTGGENFYTSPTTQVAEIDGGTITRSVWFKDYTDVDYLETLTIKAGKNEPMPNQTKTISVEFTPKNAEGSGLWRTKDYYCLNVTAVTLGKEAGWASDNFYTHGEINVTFDFLAYLVDSTGVRDYKAANISGLDADHRAEFSVHIIPVGGVASDSNRHFQWIDNCGPKQFYARIDDWSQARSYPIKWTVPAGNYFVYFRMRDTLADYDQDQEQYPYYAAFRNVNIKVTTGPTTSSFWDDTKVKVDLIDVESWTILSSEIHQLYGAESGTWNKVFTNLQPGVGYQIQYTLLQGGGTTGGLYDHGGTMQLSRGSFNESWSAYCHDVDGNYYRQGSSPNPVPTPPQTSPLPPDNSYCWIDAIMLYESWRTVCPGTGLDVTVRNGGTIVSQDIYSSPGEQQVQVMVTNNTNSVQSYQIDMKFMAGCSGDRGSLYSGRFKLIDKRMPDPSYAQITDFRATNHKPIWMGGCYTSKMHVKVYNEVGTVVFSGDYVGEGLNSFVVSKLPQSPYSKYSVEIMTEQGGQISQVTGKPYLTTFKLVDFKAYENWVFVPDPFQGKLEFFVDNTLFGTYTTPGGFFNFSYPVPKGAHEFKWVFTELGSGYSWDYCDIDLLELTNWVCDTVRVVPYCEKGGGDKCVEELIKCLLKMWRDRPKACAIGKKIWLFT